VVAALKDHPRTAKLNISASRPKDGDNNIYIFVGHVLVATVNADSSDAKVGYDNEALEGLGLNRDVLVEAVTSGLPPSFADKIQKAKFSF
jgi:hypothetical protein